MHHVVSKTLLAPIVALLMLVPPATASTVQADLAADRIQSQGMIQGEAPLTALLHPYTSSMGALPGFELAADHMRVETDYAEISIVLAEASFNTKALPDTRIDHHARATAWSTSVGSGYRFDVVPMEIGSAQATIDASCAAAAPPTQDQHSRTVLVQSEGNRPDYTVDASQSIQWETCDADATATIRGDFWFSAWAINIEVQDENGTHAYWSGHRDNQAVTEDQELYVYVTNGTLRMPLGAGYALFLSGGTTQAAGRVQLGNVRGSLTTPAGIVALDGESVTLNGDLEVATRRAGDALHVALVGDARGAMIDGQSVTFPRPTHDVAGAWWLATLAGVVLLTGLFCAPNWLYHHRKKANDPVLADLPVQTWRDRRAAAYGCYGSRLHTRAANSLGWKGAAYHQGALLFSYRAYRLNPHCPLYLLWRSWAHAALGHDKRALRDCRRLDGLLQGRTARAHNAWLAAQCADALDHEDEAEAWVRKARTYDAWVLMQEAKRFTRQGSPITQRPWMHRVLLEPSSYYA